MSLTLAARRLLLIRAWRKLAFFDITIWADGKEIQPKSAVRVNITYNNAIEVSDEGEVQAMHFEDGSKKADVLDTDTNDGSKVDEIAFDAESFSVYGIIYTVDFTYDGYTYSIAGEDSILLSDLAEILGLYEKDLDKAFSVGNVSDVTFTDYDLIKIEKQADGDWLLTSLAPFDTDETLTITMKDGVKFVVDVTDAQESSDLTYFLKNVTINGATQNDDGSYTVEQGREYTIALTFTEDSSYQFKKDATLTYTMPAGVAIPSAQNGDKAINIGYNGRIYQVDASYTLDTNGNMAFHFDQDDPDYSKLMNANDVSFRLDISAIFDGNETYITFSDSVVRTIEFGEEEPGEAYAAKTATYDESTGTFTYTIKVTASSGDVTNVNVKDLISGDAITFNNDVTVSGNSSSYTDNVASNGFDYTFASMVDGEEITITYTGTVDFSKDSDNDGKITADQTKNTVTVQPEDGTPRKSEYSREINYKSTSKSNGTEAGMTADGDKILEWTITYNEFCLAKAAEDTITDTISSGSTDYMTYYGDGITVKVYDKNGTLVGTRTLGYSDLTSYSSSSWTYTIPSTDTTPYMYEIIYQTVVDQDKVDGKGTAVTVSNDANGSGGSAQVGPSGEIGVTKAVESKSTSEVTWVSTITVPENDLDQAVVTDTVPSVWLTSGQAYDFYKDGSLSITGLLDGESYDVDTSDTSKVVITFYKDSGKTQTGLQGISGGHTITIRLTTTVDQDWLQAGYDNPGYLEQHTNTIDFNGKTAQAAAIFGKPGIEKTGEKYTENGYEKFKYSIELSSVSEVPVSIEDTFDTSILEVDSSKSIYIYGGNQYYQGSGQTPVSYSETGSGIVLTANSVPKDDDGNYYPYYRMTYYLKLKDHVNLEKLARQNGGEYDVVNTAKWGESESSYTYKTKYEYLDKQLLNEDELGGTSRTARYQITFNPAKDPIVDPDTGKVPETLTLTDTISANQSLDYSSVSIVTDPGGMSVPFSADDNSAGETVVTYTVPNETKVTVDYETLITGTGSTTFTNTAKVLDRNAPVSKTKEFGAAGENEGAIPSFTIVKVDGYDASKKLSGVKFKIYAEDDQLNFGENANYAKEITLTTEDGEIVLDGSQYTFYFDKIYYIEEVKGHDGYGKTLSPYQVTLTDDISKVDHGKHIYYYSDTMQIKNWPLEGLVVEKQVNSTEEADLKKDYTFKVSILNDDGSVNTDYNECNGDDTFVNGVFEFNLKNGGQKMFWGFEKGTKYKVEEIDADGFTTTVKYDVYDDDGNITGTKTETAAEHSGELTQADETIIFTNTKESKESLKLKKAVTVKGKESSGQEADGDYTFTIAGPTSADEADQVARTVVITIENGAMKSAAIDDGTATIGTDGYVEVTGLAAGDYTITETAPDNGTVLTKAEGGKSVSNDKVVTATVVAGQTADAVADAGKVSFTNNKPDTPSFEKKIQDTSDSSGETSDWQDSADYDIGDEIPYKLTAVLPSDASSYPRYTITFQDKMEESLDFAGVSQVVLRTAANVETEIEPGNYVLNSSTHEFTLAIAWGAQAPENMPITEDLDGATVEVCFNAALNSNAKIGSDGNVNAACLQYSNKPGDATSSDTTPWDYVIAFTYKLDVNKVDKDGKALTGAKFKLEKKLADGSRKSITLSNENNVFTGTGLDDGDYVLTETTTPEGCDPIDPIEFTVSADHTVTWNYNSTDLSFDGSTDRTTILTALTGSTESGDLVFTTPQQVSGLVGTVKNQGIGTLKIKKSVTENGGEVSSNNTKTALAGDYTFTIYTDEACTKPYQENGEDKTVTLTIPETCEAVTSDEVTGLPTGDYWIKETAPSNGSAPVTNPVKVTVEAGKTGVDAVVAEFTNNIETTEASVLKVWSDAEDQDGKRPESLTVTLSNGTEDVGTVTLNADNSWTDKIENLPKYANGTEITYSWTEGDMPEGYTLTDTSVDGTVTTLTNSHTPEVTKVEGEKTWTGDNESLRPKSVTIGLYAGDTKKDEQVISKDSNWKYSFTDLPKYEGGEEIEYTVKEETDLPGYVSTVNGYDIESSYSASGEYELEAVKKLTGRSFKTGDSWTFDVACDDADAPMPEETSVTINPSKDNSCDVNFGRITYSAADHGKTYTYTITETGTVAGVTNQADSVEIKVTVTDNGNGTLKIEAEGDGDSAVFTNEYAAEGSVTLKAQKELSAYEGKTLKDGQFSFELYQGGELKQTK